jgi:hypothetical protein
MRKFAALVAAALAGACAPPEKHTDTADAAPMGVSYSRDVKPIFVGSCNECHHPGSAIGFDLTNPFDPATGIVGRANSYAANGSMYPEGRRSRQPGRQLADRQGRAHRSRRARRRLAHAL